MRYNSSVFAPGPLVLGAVLTAVLLSACGFHAVGSRPLPAQMHKVYIDVVVPYRVSEQPVETSLRTRLVRRGATVTKEAAKAQMTIKLTNLKEGRQTLSVGPDGKALEFLLVTTVDYQVFAGDQVLMAPGHLRATRAYSFNEEQILAKEAEEARLREYIQDQLADLLLIKVETQLSRRESQAPLQPEPQPQVVAPVDPVAAPAEPLPSAPPP